MKKICVLFLVLTVLAGSLLILPVSAAQGETVQIGGVTYNIIKTVEQFEEMSGNNNYILGNDIDFENKAPYTHTVVKNHFYGILDGNGHSLLNLRIEGNQVGAGIFKTEKTQVENPDKPGEYVEQSHTYTVRNLTVGTHESRATVKSSAEQVGVLAGSVIDGAYVDISNVTIYADVEATNNGYAGGFFGRIIRTTGNKASSFKNCNFYGTVKALHSNVGGFVGRSAARINFEDCKNHGDIGTQGSTSNHVAGFVGNSYSGKYCVLNFTSCENAGTVSGQGSIGGLVGTLEYSAKFFECTNSGNVVATGTHIGGIVGRSDAAASYGTGSTTTLQLCKNTANISSSSATSHVGGLVGTVYAHLVAEKCENSGNVTAGKHAGGIIGFFEPLDTLTDTYYSYSELAQIPDRQEGGEYYVQVESQFVRDDENGTYEAIYIPISERVPDKAYYKLNPDTSKYERDDANGTHEISGYTPLALIYVREEGGEYYRKDGESYTRDDENGTYIRKYEDKYGERYTATLTDMTNTGNISISISVSGTNGSAGGIVGGTTWRARELSLTIDGATNAGEIKNLGTGTTAAHLGGIIGLFSDTDGNMLLKNCLNSGKVTGNGHDNVCGVLGYTNAALNAESTTKVPIARVVENCLNLGVLTNGDTTDNIYAIAKNKQNAGNIVNCYVKEGFSGNLGGFGTAEAKTFTDKQLASGEAAFLLGSGFGQELEVEALPVVGGNPVIEKNGTFYNFNHEHEYGDNPYEYLNSGKHQRKCTFCEKNIPEPHVYGEFKDNGDGTHSRACKHCSYVSVPQDHKMSYEDNGDGMHTAACSGCDLNKTEEHTADGYTDNGDGTHSGTCTHCGTEFTVEHTYGEGTCTACGASEAENGGTSDDGKTSGTAKTVIIISACVLGGGAVGCGTFLIIKKRKNKLG